MSIVYLTRKETFSACHRLHNPKLSDEENRKIFGKCNNANGHGHNYAVEVTVCGPVNPIDGMLMNISDLKAIIQTGISNVLDHKNVDRDVAYFRETQTISTTENLTVFIWNNVFELLKNQFPNVKLYKIRIKETEKNFVTYKGENNLSHIVN